MTTTKTTAGNASTGGWLGSLNRKSDEHELWTLPDAMSDPFASLGQRLRATLDSYRFSADPKNPGSLFDWAVGQTGLNDPLTKYTRHDLEQGFARFARDRDQFLTQLVITARREGELAEVKAVGHETSLPAARKALARAMKA